MRVRDNAKANTGLLVNKVPHKFHIGLGFFVCLFVLSF